MSGCQTMLSQYQLKGFHGNHCSNQLNGVRKVYNNRNSIFPIYDHGSICKKYKDVTTVKILKHNIMSYVQGGCHYGLSQKND
jgi:hypothetical protein